jgi:hypothetical protein
LLDAYQVTVVVTQQQRQQRIVGELERHGFAA